MRQHLGVDKIGGYESLSRVDALGRDETWEVAITSNRPSVNSLFNPAFWIENSPTQHFLS
jgi:hypothetical protein